MSKSEPTLCFLRCDFGKERHLRHSDEGKPQQLQEDSDDKCRQLPFISTCHWRDDNTTASLSYVLSNLLSYQYFYRLNHTIYQQPIFHSFDKSLMLLLLLISQLECFTSGPYTFIVLSFFCNGDGEGVKSFHNWVGTLWNISISMQTTCQAGSFHIFSVLLCIMSLCGSVPTPSIQCSLRRWKYNLIIKMQFHQSDMGFFQVSVILILYVCLLFSARTNAGYALTNSIFA